MAFYKCLVVDDMCKVRKKLLYAQSETELLLKHRDIIKFREYNVRFNANDFTINFFQIMHSLIANKYNTVQALEITLNCFNGIPKIIICTILDDIEHGISFSNTLRQFDKYFNTVIIEVLNTSEITGCLAQCMNNIVQYLEYNKIFNAKIKNAVRYPIFVLMLILSILVIWIVWIIPQFNVMFKDLELQTPTITNCLLSLSNWLHMHYVIVITVLLGILYISKHLHVKIPIISKFKNKINKLQFFDTMSLMLRERVHLVDAIRHVTNQCEFAKYSKLTKLIITGSSFALAAKKSQLFTHQEIALITISEQTGQYWGAFKAFADVTRVNLESDLNKITKRLPTVLMCVVGTLLVLLIYGTFIPLYSSIDIVVKNTI